MKLPRRRFLHLATGAAALPVVPTKTNPNVTSFFKRLSHNFQFADRSKICALPFGAVYFGAVAPPLSLPMSRGASLLCGAGLVGWVVVTPREFVVTDPPFGGS
jgi:hypothetical protein